jgi:hypothetical protein
LSSNDERLRQERRGLRRTLAVRDNAETNRRRDPLEVEVLQQQEDDQLDAAVDAEGPGPAPAAAEPLKALATERDGSGGGSSSTGASRLRGLLSLATVPVVWGTYVPAVRLMYESGVPGLVFSASYHAVSALASAAALRLASPAGPRADGGGTDEPRATIAAKDTEDESRGEGTRGAGEGIGPMAVAFRGGLELGAYTFAASSMQVVGLETVPSDRAGFLIQRTFLPGVSAESARLVFPLTLIGQSSVPQLTSRSVWLYAFRAQFFQ